MFFKKQSPNMEIARKLVLTAGIEETLRLILEKKNNTATSPLEKLKHILALAACNLGQSMKAEFIAQKLPQDLRTEIIRDYVMESIKFQNVVNLKNASEAEQMFGEVARIANELEIHWKEEDPVGPGPRYYCVKDLLHRLGGETDFNMHDSLFELMYLQHKALIDFFRKFLEKS